MSDKQVVWTTKKVEESIEKINDGYILKRVESPFFEGTMGLRRAGLVFQMTEEEIQEYIKCKLDILYFSEKYCQVKTEDGKRRNIVLRDYQRDILTNFSENRFNILMASRQCGKTITSAITIIHFMIFNNGKNCLATANKLDTVIEVLDKIREIYLNLPFFLQQGIKNTNQKAIVLENKSRIKGFATTKTASIGYTGDLLYMDEFAYIPNTIADKFYKSIFPTISSIENSKIIITSTPNGLNLFHKLLTDAERPEGDPEKNNYKPMRVYWWQVARRFCTYVRLNKSALDSRNLTPEQILDVIQESYPNNKMELYYNPELRRDVINIYNDDKCSEEDIMRFQIDELPLPALAEITTWKKEAIKDIGGEEAFNQEYDLKFINSSKSLFDEKMSEEINSNKRLYKWQGIDRFDKRLKFSYADLKWIEDEEEFKLENAKKEYGIISVDISEGLGQDYSIINIFKMREKPDWLIEDQKLNYTHLANFVQLKQIGIFRSNLVTVKQLAELLYMIAFELFDPDKFKIVLELNNYGNELLAHIPHVFDGNNEYGSFIFMKYKHRADAVEEKIGLKVGDNKNMLVKDYQDSISNREVIITNEDTVREMTTFIKQKTSSGNIVYKGDAGCSDDCVMTVVDMCSVFSKNVYKELADEFLVRNAPPQNITKYNEILRNVSEWSESSDYQGLLNVNRQRRLNKMYAQKYGTGVVINNRNKF